VVLLVLFDDCGAVLGRLDSRADDIGQSVAVDLRALRALAYAGGLPQLPVSGAWLGLACADGQAPQLSWSCDEQACHLAGVTYVDRAAPRSLDLRMPARCQAAAAGDRPLGGCRALMTREANLLLAELTDVLASACAGGACADELDDARRTVDELLRAGSLRYRSTAAGPPLYASFDEDDPPPPVRRHAFTAGTTTVTVRCAFEVSDEADDDTAEIECRLQVPGPRGPLLFLRDTGHRALSVSYLGGRIFLRGGALILSDDAVRLRP